MSFAAADPGIVAMLAVGVVPYVQVLMLLRSCGHLQPTVSLTTRRPGSDTIFAAIAGATVSAFFSFGGWWKAGKLAGEDIADARKQGATDLDIHDTVLIAAAFCMYNRYVDGLATWAPRDPEFYARMGERLARQGYGTSDHATK